MKKVLLWICVLLTLCLCGCGKKEQATETNALKDLEKSSEMNSLDMLLDINENAAKDFEYKVKNDEIHITKYIGESKKVMVPGLIGGRYVVSIGDSAFQGTDVTDVIIGDCVEEIGDSAFANCTSLEKVLLTRTVKAIGDDIFEGCSEVLVFAVEGTYSEIWARTHCVVNGKKVFDSESYTDGLAEETEASCFEYEAKNGGIILTKYVGYEGNVIIPATIDGIPVVEVGYRCFSEMSVVNVMIPSGVKKIGNEAFSYCMSLESVVIPEGVTSIGDKAFDECPLLRELVIPKSIEEMPDNLVRPMYKSKQLEKNGFDSSELYEDYSITLYVAKDTYGEEWAKKNSTGVYKVYGFTEDDRGGSYTDTVFKYEVYEYLASVEESVGAPTKVVDKSEKIEPTPTVVPKYDATDEKAFEWEENKDGGITITKLKDTSIVDVVIPERIGGKKVTRIGDVAFSRYSNFDIKIETVYIPESITVIGFGAFEGCQNLKSINIPEGVTKIGDFTFADCYALMNVELPSGITSIETGAFSRCASLTEITIPEKVTEIGVGVFEGCQNLKSINIPENVTEIGYRAFGDCDALMSIIIPESVQYIDKEAFADRTNLNLQEIRVVPNSYAEDWAIENGYGYNVIYY